VYTQISKVVHFYQRLYSTANTNNRKEQGLLIIPATHWNCVDGFKLNYNNATSMTVLVIIVQV